MNTRTDQTTRLPPSHPRLYPFPRSFEPAHNKDVNLRSQPWGSIQAGQTYRAAKSREVLGARNRADKTPRTDAAIEREPRPDFACLGGDEAC